jgi:hypothetical protein
MAHRLAKSQAKKAIIFGLSQEGMGDPRPGFIRAPEPAPIR